MELAKIHCTIGNMSLKNRKNKKERHTDREPRRVHKQTRLFLTICPNFHPKSDEEAKQRAQDLDMCLKSAFNEGLSYFVVFGKYNPVYAQDTVEKNILSKEISCGIEIGEERKLLHAHVLVDIEHNSMVSLDPKKMGEYVATFMNNQAALRRERPFYKGKHLLVNIKLLAQTKGETAVENIKKYITKTAASATPTLTPATPSPKPQNSPPSLPLQASLGSGQSSKISSTLGTSLPPTFSGPAQELPLPSTVGNSTLGSMPCPPPGFPSAPEFAFGGAPAFSPYPSPPFLSYGGILFPAQPHPHPPSSQVHPGMLPANHVFYAPTNQWFGPSSSISFQKSP